MYFHKEIFKTADVIVSPMTGYVLIFFSHLDQKVTWIT